MQRAAARMKEIDKELCQLIDQAQRLSQISVPYRDNAPRGLVARVSLCMMHLGVPKDCCSADGCREKEQLAICCLCNHWARSQHRIALGPIKLDDNGRALGGMNIVCSDVRMCDEMQKWVIDALGKGVSIATTGSGSSSKAGQQLQLASIATHLWVEVLELRTRTCHQIEVASSSLLVSQVPGNIHNSEVLAGTGPQLRGHDAKHKSQRGVATESQVERSFGKQGHRRNKRSRKERQSLGSSAT